MVVAGHEARVPYDHELVAIEVAARGLVLMGA